MKFENIISKISKLAAALIVYFLCAGFYLSIKGFVMQPDGSITLIKTAQAQTDTSSLTTPVDNNIALSLPNGPIIGKNNAPITVYEFSSFNCGHCADFHLKTLPLLKQQFIDSGKVKFIFVNFPLDKNSMKAAMLSECVPENSYENFINIMFKKQREWGLSHNPEQVMLRYAMLNGMTQEQAQQCLTNDNLAKDLLEVRQQGLDRLEIKGTPAFLIVKNGKKEIMYGAPNYKTFKNYLETKLAQ